MQLPDITLDDKYLREQGSIFVSGVQALTRLPLLQARRDRAAGLNTAGFISGYRGSPLGIYDTALAKAREHLDRYNIHFQPGLNEDLAATSIWGTQQVNLFPGARVDGVFAIWYGKGPGADRSADALKHGNAAGSSRHGGVLAVVGDDHSCQSSTLPHQSEHILQAAMIPILHPATVQEIIVFGLFGFALSRFSGCWAGLKAVSETIDSSASFAVDPLEPGIVIPDFDMPPGELSIRWPDPPLDQERRLHGPKMDAVAAFARANAIDRLVLDSPQARFGIAAAGKAYLDVIQALEDLGISDGFARQLGIRVYKIGMTWPLEAERARSFADGLQAILVVEEKRGFVEDQLARILYNHDAARRPLIVGKRDARGATLVPSEGEITPLIVARAIVSILHQIGEADARLGQALANLESRAEALKGSRSGAERIAFFCSGCPHSTSTRLPPDSRALAGIGCHGMAMQMPERRTVLGTHMGGEGATWIGQSPFLSDDHVFVNLGDGTYQHSGLLAIRAAAAAGVNVTYKILFNDAVAMTGGQTVEGHLDVPTIARQVVAEGARKVVVVSETPNKLSAANLPPAAEVHDRRYLDRVQRELRTIPGLTVLIYDQTCAAEKRRRRKRGLAPEPARHVVINEAVCEGCGDCGETSNCLSVRPVETEFGRKRTIDLSACNKDYSCIEGFCPSFVTVRGAVRNRQPSNVDPALGLPAPSSAPLNGRYDILIAGIGGTGVVTLGAILGMAAHLEGRACTVLDLTGLAQKNGAVLSQVRLAPSPDLLRARRIGPGQANLLLGCDMVVASGPVALATAGKGVTHAIVNQDVPPNAAFVMNGDLDFEEAGMRRLLEGACGDGGAEFLPATEWATALAGDAIATNLLMLGYAFQKGLLPLRLQSLLRAIELNGVAVDEGKRILGWGRLAAADPTRFATAIRESRPVSRPPPPANLVELVAFHAAHLTAYQDPAYAKRYREFVARVAEAEQSRAKGHRGLAEAVARNLSKLMSYKDEYEVARLYADGRFADVIERRFDGAARIEIHLAPPLLARRDPETGRPMKRAYGPWVIFALSLLARLKPLRSTRLDPFSRTRERRMERQLIVDYESTLEKIMDSLTPDNHAVAVELASVPEHIRGFGRVKEKSLIAARVRERSFLDRLGNAVPDRKVEAPQAVSA